MVDKIPKNDVRFQACPLKKLQMEMFLKKSGDCILILKRRMENIEKEIESLYVAKKIAKETQIKSEFQLESINKTIKFVIKKFDELEKGSRKKRWNY